jgi:hypothetical protein
VILKITQKNIKSLVSVFRRENKLSALVKTCKLPSILTLGTFKAKLDIKIVFASPPPL